MVDALCADGYTYSFYFRNQVTPKFWTDKNLSPLHGRVMSLLLQLPDKHYKCGMDNLSISPKFAKIAKMILVKTSRFMVKVFCLVVLQIASYKLQ